MSNNRRKGHNFERQIRQQWIEDGYAARTTREVSKRLDGCGIDLVGTPVLAQCKAGYARSRPKFEEEYAYIKQRLGEEFGPDHRIHSFPIILYHQLDVGRGRRREDKDDYVSMTVSDFRRIMRQVGPREVFDVI